MFLEIITPDENIFSGEVKAVSFPGSKGSFQVLKDHAPIISALKRGDIVYKDESGGDHAIAIDGGVVEVLHNNIIVLAEKTG